MKANGQKAEVFSLECGPTTGTPDIEAEEDVRRAADAASAADVEYGAGGDDYGELEKHGESTGYHYNGSGR